MKFAATIISDDQIQKYSTIINASLPGLSKKGQKYTTNQVHNLVQLGQNLLGQMQDIIEKEDLQEAKIISIYTFDKEVVKTGNPNSKISKNKHTVFLKHNVYNVLKNNTIMKNTIYF